MPLSGDPGADSESRTGIGYDRDVGDYKPQQRHVKCSVFSDLGWLTATLHCSLKQTLLEYLNHPSTFFKLTDVMLAGAEHAIPFLALRKTSVRMVAPAEDDRLIDRPLPGESVEYRVSCFLHDGLLSGQIRGHKSHRLSDFLVTNAGFFVLRECALQGRSEREDSIVKHVPVMLVNDSSVIAISDDRHR
jgi:hypothetical protein